MPDNKHTPEPWAIDQDDRPNMHWNNHIVSEANPNITICFMAHDGTELNECGEANARRIVSCVNACAGMTNEQLDNICMISGSILSRFGEQMHYLGQVEKQRDELMAALENCRLLAARHRKEEWAGHVLRFCGEAGVAGEVMR